jgi:mannose-6-phosphate isomerase-like protein (cupin superfamily)
MRFAIIAFAALAAAAQTPSTPAPAGAYASESELMTALKAAAAAAPDMHSAPVENTDHYRINVVQRTKPQGAIAHPGFIELHHIISGSGTIVTGGTIVRPAGGGRGGAGATIEGGVTRHVAKGDVVLVPAGAPHWYKDLDGGTLTYLEVRFQEVK